MPTATWHALSQDKRSRIEEVALTAFVSHGYDQASIRLIVAELGIAKGSIYQYFEDKFDLFVHLLHEAARRKLAAVAPAHQAPGDDLFDHLEALYLRGMVFWREEPRWAALGLRVEDPTVEPRLAALRTEQASQAHAFVHGLLSAASARGELRTDVSVALMTHLAVSVLRVGVREALFASVGLDPASPPSGPLHIGEDALREIVRGALRVLADGLRQPEDSPM